MPKRSNAFQAAIYIINKAVADKGAIVTEANELVDLVTGKSREVDITVQLNHSGDPFTFGIECRDRTGDSRSPQDITFVDEIKGKHQFLPIDKTILVSSTGFTRPALEKAKIYKMLTLTPDELTEACARDLLHADEEIYLHQTEYKVEWLGLELESCECHGHTKIRVPSDIVFFYADGAQYKTISEHFTELVNKTGGADKFFQGTSNPHRIGIAPVFSLDDDERPFEPVFVKLNDKLHEVNELAVEASATEEKAPMNLRHGVFKEISYAAGDVEIGDSKVSVVATVKEGKFDGVEMRSSPKRKPRSRKKRS